MDESSADLRDEHGKMESRCDLGGRPGHELQAPDGERREGMVWTSFTGLNETFEVDGADGCWNDRFVELENSYWNMAGGKRTPEACQNMKDASTCKKPCVIDGVEYGSFTEAGEALGLTRPGAKFRANNPKAPKRK